MENLIPSVFENEIPSSVINSAIKAKQKAIIKFGATKSFLCHYTVDQHPVLEEFGARLLVPNYTEDPLNYGQIAKPVIIGHIGGTSIRQSLALCSAARALGRMALWFDMGEYPETTCANFVLDKNEKEKKNGSLSQRSTIFRSLYWDKIYTKKRRSLKQNLIDKSICNIFSQLFIDFTKETPFIATHAFAAHSAVQAEMKYIVNALPGNCPYGTHLSEGTIHTAQTANSYLGYKMLRGMSSHSKIKSIPESELVYTGHYIDHLMLQHLERDCEKRMQRANGRSALRWLLSFDELSYNKDFLKPILARLLELEKEHKAVLIINIGNNIELWEALKNELPELRMWAIEYTYDDYTSVKNFSQDLRAKKDISGIHVFSAKDKILSTFTTDSMIRGSDILLTRPCDLSLYPIPKLLVRRHNREEFWNGLHAAELGDATFECYSTTQIVQMIDVLDQDRDILTLMCKCIQKNKDGGIYAGAYEVVRLAIEQNN